MGSWDASPRWNRIRVLYGAGLEDITEYVTGAITIKRQAGSLVHSCSMGLRAARLPYFVTGTFSAPSALEVWVYGSDGTAPTAACLFRGVCEAPENTGLIVPQGQVRAVSTSSEWANTPGCLLVGGFQGYTRAELLELFATAAGITLSTSGATSTEVKKPQDLQNVTILDLARRYSEADGWMFREDSGALLLIPMEDIGGPTASSTFSFAPSNYYAISERSPQRPITDWVVSGQEVYLAPDDTVTTEVDDDNGTTRTIITTVNGAVTQYIEERDEDYAPLGVAPGVSSKQTIRRTTIDYTYAANGDGDPTAQLTQRVTTKEAFYAPFADQGGGAPYYTYTDGSFRYNQTAETLQEVEKITEDFTWHVTGCYVTEHVVTRKAWLARTVETVDDATYTDSGYSWPDGTTRIEEYEVYDTVDVRTVTDKWHQMSGMPVSEVSQAYGTIWYTHIYNWRYRADITRRFNAVAFPGGRLSSAVECLWKENADGTRHSYEAKTWGVRFWYDLGTLGTFTSATMDHPEAVATTLHVDEPIPRPPMASPTLRQWALRPFVDTLTTTASGFPRRVDSYFSEVYETELEASRAMRWRARLELADRVTIEHRGTPDMREWDVVDVTDAVRALSAAVGWIESITWTLEPLTGRFRQQTVVAIDPYPSESPEIPT